MPKTAKKATSAKKKSPANATVAKTRPEELTPEISPAVLAELGDSAVAAFTKEAEALAKSAVRQCRMDVALVRHNALAAHRSVVESSAAIAKLPGVDVSALLAVPRLALALAFAHSQVTDPSAKNLRQLFARSHFLRKLLLTQADVLVMKELLPAKEVARIHAGSGPLDAASDAVALASLYTTNAAALVGKHPISSQEIAEAAAVGNQLLAVITPSGAKRAPRVKIGVDLRDRLFTLLVARHAEARRALSFVHGVEKLDEVAPLLGAAEGRSKKTKAKQPPVVEPAK